MLTILISTVWLILALVTVILVSIYLSFEKQRLSSSVTNVKNIDETTTTTHVKNIDPIQKSVNRESRSFGFSAYTNVGEKFTLNNNNNTFTLRFNGRNVVYDSDFKPTIGTTLYTGELKFYWGNKGDYNWYDLNSPNKPTKALLTTSVNRQSGVWEVQGFTFLFLDELLNSGLVKYTQGEYYLMQDVEFRAVIFYVNTGTGANRYGKRQEDGTWTFTSDKYLQTSGFTLYPSSNQLGKIRFYKDKNTSETFGVLDEGMRYKYEEGNTIMLTNFPDNKVQYLIDEGYLTRIDDTTVNTTREEIMEFMN